MIQSSSLNRIACFTLDSSIGIFKMMGRQLISLLSVLVLTSLVSLTTSAPLNLTIIHTSDFHARYDPINKRGQECKPSDLNKPGACASGFARIEALVKKLRNEYPVSLLLDAGDASQGTLWYAIHRINITTHFMNRLGYDAMAPGTHEFDNGESNIIDFTEKVKFPVLSANLNKSGVPGAENITVPSIVLTIEGEKIGIVGFTTTSTPVVALPGRFKFEDEVESVRREVKKLQAEGINKIIAVGSGGFEVDKVMAAQVEGIDLIVGGYTDTFLYTGPPPGRETPKGDYPYIVTQASGSKVLIVHSYLFVRYVGLLHITFDEAGVIVNYSGNPIQITDDYPQDPDALKDLADWRVAIDVARTSELSRSSVYLNHSGCRYEECNMGNMIADGLVFRFSLDPPLGKWSQAGIGMVNGGSIRVSVPEGKITLSTLLDVQPFGNTQDIITIAGRHLREVLWHSFVEQRRKGGFLQYAGLKVTYKYHSYQPNLTEVAEVLVRCSECRVPRWGPLEDDTDYTVVVNNFIIGGGDGYYHFKKWGKNHRIVGLVDSELTAAFVTRTYPVIYGIEDRIKVIEYKSPEEAAAAEGTITTTPGDTQPPLICTSAAGATLWSGMVLLVSVAVSSILTS